MKSWLRLRCLPALAGLLAFLPVFAGEKEKPKLDVVQTLKGHDAEVYSVAFSPDGKHVATGSFDHTFKLWDIATGRSEKGTWIYSIPNKACDPVRVCSHCKNVHYNCAVMPRTVT